MVLLWGLGFKDRPWTPEQGAELVQFFKQDPRYGGVYLIGGVDPYWRTLRGGSRPEADWANVYRFVRCDQPVGCRKISQRRQRWTGFARRSGKGIWPR